MKLFSNVYTVTQATFNLEPVHKTSYACDSDRTLLGRKKVTKNLKALYLTAEAFQTRRILPRIHAVRTKASEGEVLCTSRKLTTSNFRFTFPAAY